MPSYDYKCNKCGEKFTAFVPISKRDDVKCSECGSEQVKQLVTTFYGGGSSDSGGPSCAGSSCSTCRSC